MRLLEIYTLCSYFSRLYKKENRTPKKHSTFLLFLKRHLLSTEYPYIEQRYSKFIVFKNRLNINLIDIGRKRL